MVFNLNNKKLALVIFGSPKKNGFTASLLNDFISEINDDYEIDVLNAYEKKISPCIDCGFCKSHDACIYNDLDQFDLLLKSADLIIIATPIYNLSFPAPLKAVFDRMQRYFEARFTRNIKKPIEKHKDAVLIITSGSNSDEGFKIINKQLKLIFSIINASVIKEIFLKNTDLL